MSDDREYNREVLKHFLADGRLKAIPRQFKKKKIVLEWIADSFDWGTDYPEKEVNAILKKFHPDFAALRRLMVDLRLLSRQGGIYRRDEPPKTCKF